MRRLEELCGDTFILLRLVVEVVLENIVRLEFVSLAVVEVNIGR